MFKSNRAFLFVLGAVVLGIASAWPSADAQDPARGYSSDNRQQMPR